MSNIYLTFQGVGFTSGYRQTPWSVMCGDTPPTPTNGYATWTTIKRPLQRALTIFQDYEPMALEVSVRFGVWTPGWDTTDAAGQQTEQNIRNLTWCAGSNFDQGPSPCVYMWAYDGAGKQSDLIPAEYHGLPWIIPDGIKWGLSYRSTGGYRIRQDATFTLNNYLNLSRPPAPDSTVRGQYVTSAPNRDTPLKIAASVQAPAVRHQALARRILADSHNNPIKGTRIKLAGRSVNYPIRQGVRVWVPAHPEG